MLEWTREPYAGGCSYYADGFDIAVWADYPDGHYFESDALEWTLDYGPDTYTGFPSAASAIAFAEELAK